MNCYDRHAMPMRAISWLLILAVVVLTVQPMHMHLHHVDDAAAFIHDHVVDLHAVSANIDPAHHDDEAVFSATPDGMLKKLGDNPLLAALLVSLCVLLLGAGRTTTRRPTLDPALPGSLRFVVAPPLRAPPRR